MSPRCRPKAAPSLPAPKLSELLDRDFEREVEAERQLLEGPGPLESLKRRQRIAMRDVDPYGPRSPHSWVLDNAARVALGGDPRAEERLNRFRSAHEKRIREAGELYVFCPEGYHLAIARSGPPDPWLQGIRPM